MSKAFLKPFRSFVSGKRNRLKESGFDLDMSYITPRILAMAFPATGIEAAYRNPRHHVQGYLKQYHENRYLVFNLCSEPRYQYSSSEFAHVNATNGGVCIPITDHNVPTLYQISDFCQQAMAWLNQHEENLVVVHCLGGKGRTGLMVSCLLIASRICNTAPEAIELFNSMRLKDSESSEGGLRIPSQIRYVKLFEELLSLSNYSVPLSMTSLSLAKYTWTLTGVELGPTKASVHSIKVKRRSEDEYTHVPLPMLLNQSLVPMGQVIKIDVKEGAFSASEDCHFNIKVKKGMRHSNITFWLCSEMTQTMINHRTTSDGSSTLFLNSAELDSPENAERELGYKSSASNVESELPSERFFIKFHLKFVKNA